MVIEKNYIGSDMANEIRIAFIGSSALGLHELTKHLGFKVVEALCLEKRITADLRQAARQSGIPIETFDWIADFRKLINRYPVGFIFFIYQLDMLVPPDLIDHYSFYNLHRGNLYTNRGPNPEVWAILNGDKQTSLSLHKINDKIDSGILVDSYNIKILPTDDTLTIKIKMERGLPTLITSLHEYLEERRQGVKIVDGQYYPWITEADFTIDVENDSFESMDRKIRSQRQYNGAIVYLGDEKKYVVNIEKISVGGSYHEEYRIIGDKLEIKCQDKVIIFKMNLNPEYPPPPKFPPAKRV